jgi:hypothetical protein
MNEEMIAEAERIAALVPTSDAGKAFTGLVEALRESTRSAERAELLNQITQREFRAASLVRSERDVLQAKIDAALEIFNRSLAAGAVGWLMAEDLGDGTVA